MDITPINGCVLVKLTNSYEFVSTPDKKYDTKTSGVVIAVPGSEDTFLADNGSFVELGDLSKMVGLKVYFEEYKDGTSFEDDGEKYALIKFSDLRGAKNA